ncbi:MAG: right-handed parallel beta-helix repeat-containing protein [Nitrospirota bacterium]
MKNVLACIVMTGVLAGAVLSCGGGGGGGTPPPPNLVSLSTVTALYPVNGANWNDYAKGASVATATDTLCSAATDTACMHGGEKRVVTVTGKTSCAGLTATDALSAFDWTCDASTGTARFISTGLKDGKYLSDLLDFTTPGWKANAVTVNDGGTLYSTASSANWWANPVVADNDGGSLPTSGTVYMVTTSMSGTYTFGASKIALVSKPGTTIAGPGTSATIIWADGSGSARDHLWIEGKVNLAGDQIGVRLTSVRFSVLKGVTATNSTTGGGISLEASTNNSLSDVTSSYHASTGISLNSASNNNTLTGITASNNGQPGVWISASSNNTLDLVTASSNTTYGVYLVSASSNTLTRITASNNTAHGVYLNSSSNSNRLSEITVSDNGNVGVYLNSSSSNTILDVTALKNVNFGVLFNASNNNALTGVLANSCAIGVMLSGSSYNRIATVTATNSTSNGGVALVSSSHNMFSEIMASNNSAGINASTSSNDNTFARVTASNNVYGVLLQTSSSNVLVGVTASNNESYGVYLDTTSNNTLAGATATNNSLGLYSATASTNRITDISVAHNSMGVYLAASSNSNKFSGLFKVGNNGGTDCFVASGSTNPGLDDDTDPSDVASDADHNGLCIQQGSSDFGTATTGVSLADSFIDKVYDDSVNASDTGSAVIYPIDPTTYDWLKFENAFRGWGKDGVVGSSSSQGRWTTGLGAIWDRSITSGDTVIKGMLTLPTGTDTLTHTWSDASTTTFLRNAIEISGDSVGDDDLLCESNDICLYAPNIGSYQGHGNLVSAGTFTNGTITSVTLMKYETNGR